MAKNENLIGVIGVSDPPRENIKKAMNRLRNQGIDDIVLLTGDLRQQAETIAIVCRWTDTNLNCYQKTRQKIS